MKPQVFIEGEVVDPTLDVKVALADIFIMNGPLTAT
jgi:hypothetical protein